MTNFFFRIKPKCYSSWIEKGAINWKYTNKFRQKS